MKTETNVIYLRDVYERVKRSRVPVLSVVAITAISFVVFSFTLPRKYKASGVINVQTDYFRYPLIEEFIPSPVDLNEIASRRDALIKAAFSPEFLGVIGEKYGVFQSPRDSVSRKQEIEKFLEEFEFFSLSQTTVQISAFGSKPDVTEALAHEGIRRIIETFALDRRDKIIRARDSIRIRIESMALTQDPTTLVMASERPELLRAELSRLESEIVAMTQKFSSQHPAVTKLQKRANAVRGYLQGKGGAGSGATAQPKPLVGGEPERATQEVYDALIKKLNYLNIALDMEADSRAAFVRVIEDPVLPKGSIWPNRFLFLIWGVLSGIVIASMMVVFREFFMGVPTKARKLAKELGTSFIGEFPEVPFELTFSPGGKKTSSQGKPVDRRPRSS